MERKINACLSLPISRQGKRSDLRSQRFHIAVSSDFNAIVGTGEQHHLQLLVPVECGIHRRRHGFQILGGSLTIDLEGSSVVDRDLFDVT